ncbi:hypothetical protein ACFW3D_34060 [Streptomyces sp. NPDC058864]
MSAEPVRRMYAQLPGPHDLPIEHPPARFQSFRTGGAERPRGDDA